MNCRRFQLEIPDYLDGTLSPRAQAAAERHLAACPICRQALQAQREIAQSLAGAFRGVTESLHLPPEVGHRILAAFPRQRRAQSEALAELFFWRRWAWPLAATAAALLLLDAFLFVRTPGTETARPQPRLAEDAAWVQLSYVVPTYIFRREDGFVVDALTYQTNFVNQRLRVELASRD